MKLEVNKTKNRTFKVIFFILLILECIACYYSYYTFGEVKQFFLWFVLLLNIIPIILYFLKFKIISISIALIIAFFIIPKQVLLLVKWSDLKKESIEINKHIYRYKELNDRFPDNILAYEFKNKKLAKYFSYRNKGKRNFGLYYYIGTKGTSHYYYHKTGKWAYYPD